MDNFETTLSKEEEINILDIIKILFKKKLVILITSFIFAACAYISLIFIPDKYESSSVYSVNKDSNSTLSSIENQYGGLASLAGISLPGSTNDKTSYIIETIKSREFLKQLLNAPYVRESLVAAKNYDKKEKKLIYDINIYDPVKNKWVRNPPKGRNVIPSYIEIHEKFYLKNLVVKHNKTTDLIEISFIHISPKFASDFLYLIFNQLNEIERLKDLNKSKKSLNYLNQQINETSQKDLLDMINKLIEVQLKQQMLANVNENYLIEPVDMPVVPEIKSSPNRFFITIVFSILGIFFSSMIIVMRSLVIST